MIRKLSKPDLINWSIAFWILPQSRQLFLSIRLLMARQPVHLEIEDGLSLFVGEQAVLHEPGDKILLSRARRACPAAGQRRVSSENRMRNSRLSCTFRQKG